MAVVRISSLARARFISVSRAHACTTPISLTLSRSRSFSHWFLLSLSLVCSLAVPNALYFARILCPPLLLSLATSRSVVLFVIFRFATDSKSMTHARERHTQRAREKQKLCVCVCVCKNLDWNHIASAHSCLLVCEYVWGSKTRILGSVHALHAA